MDKMSASFAELVMHPDFILAQLKFSLKHRYPHTLPKSDVRCRIWSEGGGSKECITMERGLNAQESCLSVCPLNRATQRLNYSFKPRGTKGKELDSTPAFVVKHLET